MNDKEKKHMSKFLSLVLRHKPKYINLELDENGWAEVDELIEKAKSRHMHFSFDELIEVVTTNDKQRFSFNQNNTKIRANQGHTVKTVDLKFEPKQPPEFLYHGTVDKFLESIKTSGLDKRRRQHVHLSEERETAIKVGSRRGVPIILSIRALEMHRKGYEFYCSENKVWLTDHVPTEFIEYNLSSCPNCKDSIEYSPISDVFMKVKFKDKSEKKVYKKRCENCGTNLVMNKYTRNHLAYSNYSNWELD